MRRVFIAGMLLALVSGCASNGVHIDADNVFSEEIIAKAVDEFYTTIVFDHRGTEEELSSFIKELTEKYDTQIVAQRLGSNIIIYCEDFEHCKYFYGAVEIKIDSDSYPKHQQKSS